VLSPTDGRLIVVAGLPELGTSAQPLFEMGEAVPIHSGTSGSGTDPHHEEPRTERNNPSELQERTDHGRGTSRHGYLDHLFRGDPTSPRTSRSVRHAELPLDPIIKFPLIPPSTTGVRGSYAGRAGVVKNAARIARGSPIGCNPRAARSFLLAVQECTAAASRRSNLAPARRPTTGAPFRAEVEVERRQGVETEGKHARCRAAPGSERRRKSRQIRLAAPIRCEVVFGMAPAIDRSDRANAQRCSAASPSADPPWGWGSRQL
jgi:hypothetical protein